MSKQRCSVKVTSSSGEAWTTPRGARRLIARKMARAVNPKEIAMLELDYRFACQPSHPNGPVLEVVASRAAGPGHQILVPYGFLHYPHRWQTSSGLAGWDPTTST